APGIGDALLTYSCGSCSCQDTVKLTAIKVGLCVDQYLGINMIDQIDTPVDSATALATVVPIARSAYHWTLNSSITEFDPEFPTGNAAKIKETGVPSTSDLGETVDVEITPGGFVASAAYTVVQVDVEMQGLPVFTSLSPDKRYIAVTFSGKDFPSIQIVDTKTLKIIKTFTFPGKVLHVRWSKLYPDLYVSVNDANQISVIGTRDWELEREIFQVEHPSGIFIYQSEDIK
ncbi:MAG: hypothetical protein DSZ05_00175, partial [Sulfurospirillum sp.]